MAGPGIRYYEIGKALSRYYKIALAAPNNDNDMPASEKDLTFYSLKTTQSLKKLYTNSAVVICQGYVTAKFPFLLTGKVPLIIDLYDPLHIEMLAINDAALQSRGVKSLYEKTLDMLLAQLKYGDFFICASERQRDFWLGMLSSVKRINPLTFKKDNSLRNLIDIVPFGFPQNPPTKTKSVLKGVYPGINPTDKVILWGGGIWDWLDPITPIKAMAKIEKCRRDIKLFFLGIKRPSQKGKVLTNAVQNTIETARKYNLLDRVVFFNKGWVPYEERHNYLLEADVGLITYKNTIETHLSWRTRTLDYIWADLPIICNNGDCLSQLVAEKKLGIVLDNSCEKNLADAILSTINNRDKKEFKNNILKEKKDLTWENAIKPLIKFCGSPQRAADKV